MSLTRRLMWPKRGEDVAIFRQGKLMAEGHVLQADEAIIIMDERADTTTITSHELASGIEDGTIVVKKRTGPLMGRSTV